MIECVVRTQGFGKKESWRNGIKQLYARADDVCVYCMVNWSRFIRKTTAWNIRRKCSAFARCLTVAVWHSIISLTGSLYAGAFFSQSILVVFKLFWMCSVQSCIFYLEWAQQHIEHHDMSLLSYVSLNMYFKMSPVPLSPLLQRVHMMRALFVFFFISNRQSRRAVSLSLTRPSANRIDHEKE